MNEDAISMVEAEAMRTRQSPSSQGRRSWQEEEVFL